MKKLLWVSIAVVAYVNSAYTQVSYIPFSQTLYKGGIQFQASAEYYNTQSIADVNGQTTAASDGFAYMRVDGDLSFMYGMTDYLQLMLGVRSRYISTDLTADYGTAVQTRKFSTLGVESTLIGFKYSFPEMTGLKYAIEGYYRSPNHSNDLYTDGTVPDTVALGDDSRAYAIAVDLDYRSISNNYLDAHIAYRSPADYLAHEIFGKFQAGLAWKTFAMYGGIETVISRNNSAYSDNPSTIPNVFQGFSNEFVSVNRSWTAPYAGVNFSIEKKWMLTLQYAQDTAGKSTSLDQRVLIGLTHRSDKKVSEYSKHNSKFKQYRIEGRVIKLSKTRRIVIVDQGITSGLSKGMRVDFYHNNFKGINKIIASGIVVKAKSSRSLVKITKKYSRKRVEEGTVIRADQILE